ncbi:cupin domain-containing protein [Roseateles sp. LYH14W]|jgi:mannose-6-phosphate isomerase-like protein (cupin superfamily)|uniref:Cupin domain-containing protein n=1 Tax=Pelomonas parva TaxID=3299032 RepID=A0ABW7EWQ7_9BURK
MNPLPIRFDGSDCLHLGADLAISRGSAANPFNGFAGFTFTPVSMARDAPHGGEMHPDGDEILYVVAGRITVTLELDSVETTELGPGQGLVVPRGVWHKVHVLSPAELITLSPGPRLEFRALQR